MVLGLLLDQIKKKERKYGYFTIINDTTISRRDFTLRLKELCVVLDAVVPPTF